MEMGFGCACDDSRGMIVLIFRPEKIKGSLVMWRLVERWEEIIGLGVDERENGGFLVVWEKTPAQGLSLAVK